MTPNVVGMGTHADGGVCATKPYISSGKYLQRMGPSMCAGCQFNPALTTGATACPLNHLYWDFLERQRDRLKSNVRMAGPPGPCANGGSTSRKRGQLSSGRRIAVP